ncbi:hypothetical protein FOXG_07215 [Fusarium oxysporum f. sp. lycopersici 4287]|uniref:Rhodopsin domain-containing protein n=1 Tax=Fusarium oxysporum f. sp. lycopersici (strain 4287 / CBS 123668 / FGSC 9935 / NRRL 34936) TaxID=426428 RepID=A0A0J9V050_FUSO4|nr:hypothetical protein FOXG_19324 [Fusarium oxysporum f. sp. lycopersici 4287]XP_018242633.1 hypothetical protein FOXG_06647 [Fusarium oxysporum f. sp. lycopersici 4287]XP_018244566.1 hypothetical protein FOXG_07215 [Fusarium oxysporum f. sp. lycopersici 4287]KNB04548.1 hypothetical protein FOXG_19324 [Fusarium oxysporum f. sp. lycopersici 4287]KNB04588.1 hypothetical protein FOXG_06647 [Fusarium oxysporum f. sp. lycopersici 4287]KNB06521.1 hypothetical protein FOXG_07215 [Fusarium oxysporum 
MLLSILAIAARLSTRAFVVKKIGPDDGWRSSCTIAFKWRIDNHTVLIAIAFLFGLALSTLYMLSTRYGEGLHIEYLQPENVPTYTRVMLLSGLIYGLCQMFIKLSYLSLYLRIAPHKTYRLALYVSMVLVFAFGISTSLVSMLLCLPFEKLWKPDIPGHCIDINTFYMFNTTANMIFDIAIYAMPIQILWHLNLPKRQRMGLVLVFALGFLVLVASVFRLVTLVRLLYSPDYRGDNTWTTVESLNWSSVEIHLALVLSCTVAFKTLIQRFLPGVLERASRSTKNIVSRGWPRGAKHDGDYVLQSVGHNESRANIATRGDSNEADEIGSQNPIVEDVEMAGLKGAASYRSLNSSIGDQVGSRQLPAEQGGW